MQVWGSTFAVDADDGKISGPTVDLGPPSIRLWSVGNEVGEKHTDVAGAALAWRLADVVREEDMTKPVSCAMNDDQRDMPQPEVLDLIGYNYAGEGIRTWLEWKGMGRVFAGPQQNQCQSPETSKPNSSRKRNGVCVQLAQGPLLKRPYEDHPRWNNVIYEFGTLRVVVYNNGWVWATDAVIEDDPTDLVLSAVRSGKKPDGCDFSFITMRTTIADGHLRHPAR